MVTLPKHFFTKHKKQILIIGLGLRLICIFLPPLWEDDWSRYLWEGNLIRNGESPYQMAPSDFFQKSDLSEKEIEILSQINHPDWTTIYSPFVLLFFTIFSFEFSGVLLKLSYLVFETLSFIYFSRKQYNKSQLLYWLFPILIKEVYLNFHFEILIISFFWIFLNAVKDKKRILAGILLGLLVHIKPFSVLYSFYLFRKLQFKNEKNFWILWIFILLSIFFGFFIFYFIYFIISPATLDFGITNLLKFGSDFKFNQFYEPIWNIFGVVDLKTFPFLLHLITMSVYVFVSLGEKNRYRKFTSASTKLNFYFLYGYFFLTLFPVYNPWYFLILIPFLVTSKSERITPWILISVTQLSYLTKARFGLEFNYFYEIPDSILLFEGFVSIFCLFCHFNQIFILLYRISNISNIARKGSIEYGNRN